MKFFILAGEASGDNHAANLIQALRAEEPEAVFVGMGGDHMAAAGCKLLQHYREMAFMGIVAVVKNLDKVRHNFAIARKGLLREQPDVLVLIDYPSFNLKMAKWCRAHLPSTRIVYYIPPKIWAWKTWRVHAIARYTDMLLGIFPFETPFYKRYGYACTYVGNPTAAQCIAYQASHTLAPRQNIIAILPGSRKHEIVKCLPRMLEAAERFPDYTIHVAKAPGMDEAFYKPFLQHHEVLRDDTYTLLSEARAAVVNSGTATLEAALLDCPQVAVYHVACGRLLNVLRPLLFKTPFFTLVNILPQREVIRELLAHLFTPELVAQELNRLLHDETYRSTMLAAYGEIKMLLGDHVAATEAAKYILRH